LFPPPLFLPHLPIFFSPTLSCPLLSPPARLWACPLPPPPSSSVPASPFPFAATICPILPPIFYLHAASIFFFFLLVFFVPRLSCFYFPPSTPLSFPLNCLRFQTPVFLTGPFSPFLSFLPPTPVSVTCFLTFYFTMYILCNGQPFVFLSLFSYWGPVPSSLS